MNSIFNRLTPGMTTQRQDILKLLLFSACISLSVSLCYFFKGLSIIPEGPASAIFEATKSIYEHGTVSSAYFYSIADEARKLSQEPASTVWQDVFSLGGDGRLLPKHSIFSVYTALPFYILFGTTGIWIMQQCFLLLMVVCIYKTACILSQKKISVWFVIICSLILSPFTFLSPALSYDVQAASLIIAGLYVSYRNPMFGSILLMLSYFIRPSNLLLALPLSCCFVKDFKDYKRITAIFAGLAIAALFIFYCNYRMYGNPLLMSYLRLPEFINGQMILSKHPVGFDSKSFLTGWVSKIWGPAGMLPYMPCLIALPYLLIKAALNHQYRPHLLILLSSLIYILYIFSYSEWYMNVGTVGNRFLLPALSPYLAVFIALISIKSKKTNSIESCKSD